MLVFYDHLHSEKLCFKEKKHTHNSHLIECKAYTLEEYFSRTCVYVVTCKKCCFPEYILITGDFTIPICKLTTASRLLYSISAVIIGAFGFGGSSQWMWTFPSNSNMLTRLSTLDT